MPTAGGDSDSVAHSGTKLSLRGLLHYLWDQADLTRWQAGFAGKRTWGTVRKHLLLAAENKIARGDSLGSRLYSPEVFSVDQRDAINTRRMAQWSQAIAAPGKPQQLMLLIAEVKEIVPARYGFKAVVKFGAVALRCSRGHRRQRAVSSGVRLFGIDVALATVERSDASAAASAATSHTSG